MILATVPAAIVPTILGVPVDFILFGAILLGVAIFYHHTFRVALIGLSVIVAYKLIVTGFNAGPDFGGLVGHLFAREQLQTQKPIQGNLDPVALLIGGKALDRAVDRILESFAAGPFIFNLGHGVLPDTPIAHVEQLVARVRTTT